jgi:cathepsin B
MDKLSSSLQTKIKNRPLNTMIRSDSKKLNNSFIKLTNYIAHRIDVKIPDIFDGRKVWVDLLPPVQNQGTCGSCWAFATTDVLASKFNIHSLGKMKITLSAAKVVLCDLKGAEIEISHPYTSKSVDAETTYSGCFGNSLLDACRYLYLIGTSTLECVPYNKNTGKFDQQFNKLSTFSGITSVPLCSYVAGPYGDMCSDNYIDYHTGQQGGTPCRFYRAISFYGLPGTVKDNGSELVLRDNIFKWGPICTGIKIYPNFYTFDPNNEIYEWDNIGPQVGGHAVVLVGWGEDKGKKYWIVKNSWGVDWGMDGYFYMIRGVNECDIETNCVSLVPDYWYPIDYDVGDIAIEFSPYKEERLNINTQLDITAGGIDNRSGYTRRTMLQMPWIKYTPPINYKDLPNWKKFIAGIDCNIENRFYKSDLYKNKSTNNKLNKLNKLYLITLIIIIIIITILCLMVIF